MRARKKDPATDEVIVGRDPVKPIMPDAAANNHSEAEKKLYLQKAEEQLKWQRIKNEKAEMELKAKQGGMVFLEEIKQQVLTANQIVKQQVLAVIERANLPREARLALRKEMMLALNELAYEQSNHRKHV